MGQSGEVPVPGPNKLQQTCHCGENGGNAVENIPDDICLVLADSKQQHHHDGAPRMQG